MTTKHPRLKPPSTGLVDAGWATPELVDQIAAVARLQKGDPEEERLLRAVAVDAEPVDEGVNSTYRLMFEDGSDGYFKPIDDFDEECAEDYGHDAPYQAIHEAVAWQTARRVFGPPQSEMVPPCVLTVYGGRLGSLARGRDGGVGGPFAVSSADLDAAGMFDSLIGQQDRHGGNFLTSNGGETMTLIDHGFAFGRPGDPLNQSVFAVSRSNGRSELTPRERFRLQALVESPTLLGLGPMLAPDRASAMQDRARRMLQADRVGAVGEYVVEDGFTRVVLR